MAERHVLQPGYRVIWRHKPVGGYGYTLRLPVTVVKILRTKVRIRTETGHEVVVSASSLVIPSTMRHVTATVEGFAPGGCES